MAQAEGHWRTIHLVGAPLTTYLLLIGKLLGVLPTKLEFRTPNVDTVVQPTARNSVTCCDQSPEIKCFLCAQLIIPPVRLGKEMLPGMRARWPRPWEVSYSRATACACAGVPITWEPVGAKRQLALGQSPPAASVRRLIRQFDGPECASHPQVRDEALPGQAPRRAPSS